MTTHDDWEIVRYLNPRQTIARCSDGLLRALHDDVWMTEAEVRHWIATGERP